MEQEESLESKEQQEIFKLDKRRDFLKDYKNGVSTAISESERKEIQKEKSERSIQHGVSKRDIFADQDNQGEWENYGVRRAWEIKAQIARKLFFLGKILFILNK